MCDKAVNSYLTLLVKLDYFLFYNGDTFFHDADSKIITFLYRH